MAEWIAPVYDRTSEDVAQAKTQISAWKATPLSDTPLPTVALNGCMNVADMNRIEGDVQYLYDLLTAMGYTPSVSTKSWAMGSLPTAQDVQRIIANVQSFVDAFAKPAAAPDLPSSMSGYAQVNAIEENLYWINYLLAVVPNSYQKSNMFKAGARRMLPLRR